MFPLKLMDIIERKQAWPLPRENYRKRRSGRWRSSPRWGRFWFALEELIAFVARKEQARPDYAGDDNSAGRKSAADRNVDAAIVARDKRCNACL